MYTVTDKEVAEFLDQIEKASTKNSYKTSMKFYLEYTQKTGKELLEIKKADKDFQVEKSLFAFKKWLLETKKTIDENGIVHFTKDVQNNTVHVQLEDTTSTAKSELWDSLKREIQGKYEENGLPLDVDTLNSKESMDNAVQILQAVQANKKKESEESSKAPRGGDTSFLYPNKEESTIQLDESTDINNLEFSDEKQLIQTLNTLAFEKNNPQAKEILGKLGKKALSKNQTYEFQGKLTKDYGERTCLVNQRYKPIDSSQPEAVIKDALAHNKRLEKNNSAWVKVE